MTDAVAPDELRLAQLACAKLARLVEGALTIGLPALVTGVPEPRAFLEERFRVLGAFALVLHSVFGKPGDNHALPRLRERSARLLGAVQDVQRQLLNSLDTPGGTCRDLGPVRERTVALCDALEGYTRLIGLDGAPVAGMKATLLQVMQSLAGLHASPESAAV